MATVHRFFVPQSLRPGTVDLPAETAHQVTTVLRLRPGSVLVLFDGSGDEWTGELTATGRAGATVRLLRQERPAREASVRVALCLAVLKSDRFEWALQKGTELGVTEFRPLITRRTVAAGGGAKGERWRRIVTEAAEQCGRVVVPRVAPASTLDEALAGGGREGPAVLLWESERRRSFAAALAQARSGATGDAPVRLLVGPEGGFDPQEAAAAQAAGAFSATLGPRILRSETAALAAVALTCLGE